jgi:hypothetical protein
MQNNNNWHKFDIQSKLNRFFIIVILIIYCTLGLCKNMSKAFPDSHQTKVFFKISIFLVEKVYSKETISIELNLTFSKALK